MQERKRLVFKNTPWGDRILNPLVMADWNYDGWLAVLLAEGCKPEPEPFVPTFITARIISGNMGEVNQEIGNGTQENFMGHFATEETANALAKRFGGKVIEIDPNFGGGVHTVPEKAYGIQKDGKVFNAGVLASYFIRMPENEFPGAAEKAVKIILDVK